MGMLGWPHLLLIFAVLVLLFGAAKLPVLARSLGQSARVFKGEMRAMQTEDSPAPGQSVTNAPTAEGGTRDAS
jgi:sec-independent protein translocase protein TatA